MSKKKNKKRYCQACRTRHIGKGQGVEVKVKGKPGWVHKDCYKWWCIQKGMHDEHRSNEAAVIRKFTSPSPSAVRGKTKKSMRGDHGSWTPFSGTPH
jgi:predicted NUDIX family NTP pyrophosphohydrolase